MKGLFGMKKKIPLLLSFIIIVGIFGGMNNSINALQTFKAGEGATASSSQESISENTVVIYTFNEEFKNLFDDYYVPTHDMNFEVEFVLTPSYDNEYINTLDSALINQSSNEMKLDIFIAEPDYVNKYINSPYVKNLTELGLTGRDLSRQFPYVLEMATSEDGEIKAAAWNAEPGAFIYRRSVAQSCLGTDDPAEVEKMISDWDKFEQTAEKITANSDCYMVYSPEDIYRLCTQSRTTPWVQNGVVTVDSKLKDWADMCKSLYEKGCISKNTMWSLEWSNASSVFGYFGAPWFAYYVLSYFDNAVSGDWACCRPTESYYWGGCFICAAEGSDSDKEVLDIIRFFTADASSMLNLAEGHTDYPNNRIAATQLIRSDAYSSINEFYNYQPINAVFSIEGESITLEPQTSYDFELDSLFITAMKDYIFGIISYDTALANFYTLAIEAFPSLTIS